LKKTLLAGRINRYSTRACHGAVSENTGRLSTTGRGKTMDARKKQYVAQIRSNTAYPTYRTIVGVIAVLGYLTAVIVGIVQYFVMQKARLGSDEHVKGLLFCFVVPVLIVIATAFLKEAALILADISDSITDANSKNQSGA